MNNGGGVSGGAAPTGCYKCGRPGHWSRDCPSNPNTSTTNNDETVVPPNSEFNSNTSSRPPLPTQKPKQKAPRRTRPKLTPDLLLSDAGIGHILRFFPRAFKCRGRGHEVNDLRHLLRLYAEWHSRLLPYYNFDQFIHKVEQVGSSKRVKVCLRELQDRVANGVDPTKLHEPQVQENSTDEQDAPADMDLPSGLQENNFQNEDTNNFQEDMPQDSWEKATEETSGPVHDGNVPVDTPIVEEVLNQSAHSSAGVSIQNDMSEEQKARMEANRLKALERAVARSRSSRA